MTTFSDLPRALTCMSHVVQPRVCPGVRRAISFASPKVTVYSVLEYAIDRAGFPPFAVKVLALASAGYHVGVPLHHLHARPGQLLDERMSRHMIRVRMACKKDF